MPALVEVGEQLSEQGQSQVLVGFQGGLSRGQSWFRAWEEETQQEETRVRVTEAKAAAKEAAKAAAKAAAMAAAQVTAKAAVGAKQEEAGGQAGSSHDHLAQQGRQEETEQEARVKQAKEVQAGILAKLTRWLGGCQ